MPSGSAAKSWGINLARAVKKRPAMLTAGSITGADAQKGWADSPISGRPKVGCMCRPCPTCSCDVWSAGSMSAAMAAELVTDEMAILLRGRPKELLHHFDRGSPYPPRRYAYRWPFGERPFNSSVLLPSSSCCTSWKASVEGACLFSPIICIERCDRRQPSGRKNLVPSSGT